LLSTWQEGKLHVEGHIGTYYLDEFQDADEYRKVATVKAMQIPVEFSVATEEGLMTGQPGDYLCQGPAGELWPVRASIFEKTYEKMR